MPSHRVDTQDTFYSIPVCSGEKHTFASLGQKNLWRKLHCKKCSICRNALVVNLGSTTTQLRPSQSPADIVYLQQQQEEQQELQRTIIGRPSLPHP